MISGEETSGFLNDILTAQLNNLNSQVAQHTCLLSPQGVIKNDMFLVKKNNTEFLLITEKEQINEIFKFLSFYKLRKKIDISLINNVFCGHIFSKNHNFAELLLKSDNDIMFLKDSRSDDLGIFCICFNQNFKYINFPDSKDWNTNRIILGIAQGSEDLLTSRTFMLEAWLDELGSVDFKKGCFIGQEVTARMFYRATVKKKFIPIIGSKNDIKNGEKILLNGNEIGIVCSNEKFHADSKVGLAKINISSVFSDKSEEKELYVKNKKIELKKTKWMDSLISKNND